jgi:3-hydroxyisobutyrate dehydrogenase-like beta-hydroxyacid dehydrogenase
MTQNETIGFIGLGLMGKPMAENLLAAGYRLRVFNRSSEKAASLAQSGATVVSAPQDTAETGGIVMSCVADDAALEAVVGSSGELAGRLGEGGVHVSMSTVLPETAARLSRQHAACRGCYVAAPVMGRPDVVKLGKQSYYVAGDAAAKARIKPVLEQIGTRIFDFGENPADANTAKLGANFLIAATIEAMSEAFVLMEKNGVDPAVLHDALASTLFACPIFQNYGRSILDEAYRTPLFKLALGLKDIRLINRAADVSGTPMRFASVLKDRFLSAMAHGRLDYDWTGIAAEIREEAGI